MLPNSTKYLISIQEHRHDHMATGNPRTKSGGHGARPLDRMKYFDEARFPSGQFDVILQPLGEV
jgi:hypothetical protein